MQIIIEEDGQNINETIKMIEIPKGHDIQID